MPYALVQKSLDQRIDRIDRTALEEASVHARSVARADCARLQRQLFGIVVSGLPYDEAVAFQTALEHFGFPTEVVPQRDLPLLTPPKFRRGIRFQQDCFVDMDGLGREESHPWDELQYAAGGFVQTTKEGYENGWAWKHAVGWRGNVERTVEVVKRAKDVPDTEFRLEFFLSREPWRLLFRSQKDSLFRYDGAVLRFHQQDHFLGLLRRVAEQLPSCSLSLGILAAVRGEVYHYPSVGAFEEETTWQLFQRLRQ